MTKSRAARGRTPCTDAELLAPTSVAVSVADLRPLPWRVSTPRCDAMLRFEGQTAPGRGAGASPDRQGAAHKDAAAPPRPPRCSPGSRPTSTPAPSRPAREERPRSSASDPSHQQIQHPLPEPGVGLAWPHTPAPPPARPDPGPGGEAAAFHLQLAPLQGPGPPGCRAGGPRHPACLDASAPVKPLADSKSSASTTARPMTSIRSSTASWDCSTSDDQRKKRLLRAPPQGRPTFGSISSR